MSLTFLLNEIMNFFFLASVLGIGMFLIAFLMTILVTIFLAFTVPDDTV